MSCAVRHETSAAANEVSVVEVVVVGVVGSVVGAEGTLPVVVDDGIEPVEGAAVECDGARQVVSGHAPEPFAQLIGCGEAEVTDLIQILDAHVTTGATRDEQRPDRLDITIRALRDPRCPTRQRRPPGFDRVDHIGLPLPASQLTVRTINLDHDHTLATQITRETRTVRAGAFHPHPRQFSKAGQPAIQLPETRPRRRERLHTQHAAGSINCRRDMHIQMGIDSARDQARALYDGHLPSLLSQTVKGWHARPGKETVTSTLL